MENQRPVLSAFLIDLFSELAQHIAHSKSGNHRVFS